MLDVLPGVTTNDTGYRALSDPELSGQGTLGMSVRRHRANRFHLFRSEAGEMASFATRRRSRSPVSNLLRPRGPAAVGWFVMPVHVDAVERCANRAWPHIAQECGEVLPFVADSYAATAVIRIRRVAGLLASGAHVQPRTVFARGATASMPMSRVVAAIDRGCLAQQASATTNTPRAERVTAHDTDGLAIAAALPLDAAISRRADAREHNKSSNPEARKRNERRHVSIVSDKWGDR